MKISTAFGNAFRAFFRHPGAALKFLLTEGCLMLICLAPLLFLTESAPLLYLAALTPVLWVLLMLPARVNAAAAMQDSLDGGRLFSLQLVDPSKYWKKLGYGLSRTILLLIWGVPLIAGLLYGWEQYSGDTDGLTVMQMIHDLGGKDMKTGVFYLILILLGLFLLLVIGMCCHCGDRHAFALGRKGLLKGHRGKLMLCWILSLLFLLPLFAALGVLAARYAPMLNNLSGVVTGNVEMPSTRTSLIILAAGAALTIPLLPLRSMVTAAFVNGLKDSGKP